MKTVYTYIEHVEDELGSAEEYAEKYVEYKTSKPQWAKMYHDMSMQELVHAQNFKDMGDTVFNDIKATYMPDETETDWVRCVKHFADDTAKIKVMLSM